MPIFINHLKKESELIQCGFELLQAYRIDLEGGESVSPGDLRMAVFAMQVAFENSHLVKEESLLYPALFNCERWHGLSTDTQSSLKMILDIHHLIRKCLLELRMGIDHYERDLRQKGLVGWRLGEFVDHSLLYLKDEKEILFVLSAALLSPPDQKNLFLLSQSFDAACGLDHLQGPRLIFTRLRQSKGMSAA